MPLRNATYNMSLPADFCEGKLTPYLISPDIYEFFSAMTGSLLFFVGISGMMQPNLEILLKLMYSGISVSGVGTVLLHYKRILVYNYADVYPLLITLSLGLIALLDEIVFEFRRPRGPDGGLIIWKNNKDRKEHSDSERTAFERTIMDAFVFIFAMFYMILGLCLVIFAKDFDWDVIGVYFGATFAITAFGGMFFFSKFRPSKNVDDQKHLTGLRNVAAAAGVIGIVFKVLDSFVCGPVVVWIFPHAIFHTLTTYATHCFIVFMGFYRADNNILEHDPRPKIKWIARVYPYIWTPDVPDIDDRNFSSRFSVKRIKEISASISPKNGSGNHNGSFDDAEKQNHSHSNDASIANAKPSQVEAEPKN